MKIVDVSYGGENGFNQAIELASESLANVKFIQEKKLIGKPFILVLQLEWVKVFLHSKMNNYNYRIVLF